MRHNACKTSEPRAPQEASPLEKTLRVVGVDSERVASVTQNFTSENHCRYCREEAG